MRKKYIIVFYFLIFSSSLLNAQEVFHDSFDRTVTGALGSQWNTLISSGNISVDGNQGIISYNNSPGIVLGILDNSLSDSEILANVTLITGDPDQGYSDVGLFLRSTDDALSYYIGRFRVSSNGTTRAIIQKKVSGQTINSIIGNVVLPMKAKPGDRYRIRFSAINGNPTQLGLKIWEYNSVEPASWSLLISDNEPVLQNAGFAGLRSGTSSDFNGVTKIAIDDLSVSFCGANSGDCGMLKQTLPECKAIAVEDTAPFPGCESGYSQLVKWCSGDCSSDDAKVTICCKM